MTARILLGAALGLSLSTAALAQSYTAPAGIPASTAPGGLEGRAGLPNFLAERDDGLRVGAPYGTVDDLATGSVAGPHRGRALDRR